MGNHKKLNWAYYFGMTTGCILSVSGVKGFLVLHVESIEALPFDMVVRLCSAFCWLLL